MSYIDSLMAENEEIVVRTRRHWMVLVRSFLINLALLIAIVVLVIVAIVPLGPAGLLATVLFIIPVAAFSRDYLKWWNEEYIVTNRRVIQAEGVINKHVIDSSLEKVNDVVLQQTFWGRIFDYGDIQILTASEEGVNDLRTIEHPIKFKTEMLNQKETFVPESHLGAPSGHVDIPALIAELDQLRKQGVLTEAEFQAKKTQLLDQIK
jgi:uncharacterized membrane protein YdbT with pleckstrin-like domain